MAKRCMVQGGPQFYRRTLASAMEFFTVSIVLLVVRCFEQCFTLQLIVKYEHCLGFP